MFNRTNINDLINVFSLRCDYISMSLKGIRSIFHGYLIVKIKYCWVVL